MCISKLEEIQSYADKLNDKLYLEFGYERVDRIISGGNLFLGTNYAKSDALFITFNPGKSQENNPKFFTSLAKYNRYWDSYKDKDYQFWKNSRHFFNSQPHLKTWLSDITSTFLIPWRTPNIFAFNKDVELKRRINAYSGEILRRIIEHHQAKILIISGIATLRLLTSGQFLDFDLKQSIERSSRFYLGVNYQCGKVKPNRNYKNLTLLQIPHFSRANKRAYLEQCASWLWNEVSAIYPV